MQTFEHAADLSAFLLGRNHRVEQWLADNRERIPHDTPTSKTTVSNALAGKPVSTLMVEALTMMWSDIRNDPWAWCEPPNRLERLSEYAPLKWWYNLLRLDDIPWSVFQRINTVELSPERALIVKERYDNWYHRLRRACDQFKQDRDLVRALEADDDPEFQTFYERDGEWFDQPPGRAVTGRVGNAGLRGRSREEIGVAIAMQDMNLPLPDIERACVTYERPEPVPVDAWASEPVEAFMGDTFDLFEERSSGALPDVRGFVERPSGPFLFQLRASWDGSRYQFEDVQPFARVFEAGEWRDTTPEERELWITGLERRPTRAQLADELGDREAWIERLLADPPRSMLLAKDKRALAASRYDNLLDRIDDREVMRHNLEIDARVRKFNRGLRRRKPSDAELTST